MTTAFDWASPPGDTIRDMLRERGLSARWLAVRMGRPFRQVFDLIAGKEFVDSDLAEDLASAIGQSKDYWLAHEANYRLALARAIDEGELP